MNLEMSTLVESINSWSGAWCSALWRASWQGALTIAIVWATCRAWPKLPSSVRCWLWRLAYLKLLATFLWIAPVDLPLLPATPEPLIYPVQPGFITPSVPDLVSNAPKLSSELSPVAVAPTVWLLLFWLVGVGWYGVRVLREWNRTRRLLRSYEPVHDEDLIAICVELCRQFRLRRSPQLLQTADAGSPLLQGVFKPVIVLPSALVADCATTELRLMLAHELAHLKRRDLLWSWLPTVAQAFFYFHPLVWLAQAEWRLSQEMACDELALRVAEPDVSDYGKMLLKVAGQCLPTSQKGFATAAVVESCESLERRLIAMQNLRRFSRKQWLATGMVVGALGVAAVVPWRLVEKTQADEVVASGVPAKRAYVGAERERRVMTAAEKREFDAYLDRIERQAVKSAAYMREQEKQGVLTVKESARLHRIGAYLQNKKAVPDEEVDFVLHLIERGPLVNTDINRVKLRMTTISSLTLGRGLTEAQQQRAIKVIGPIANDPPKEKIVYFDGIQSGEISVQLSAIGFLYSTRHPEALTILRTLQKTTQVKEARESIDKYLASLDAR